MGEKAIFLAKDGTLVDDVGHNVDPRRVRLSDAAVSGLRVLRGSGFRLVVVSNQSGVARGYFSGKELLDVERALGDLLSYHGLGLDGFYYCPHHPNGVRPEYAVSCVCRKPKPELLTRAAAELDLDLARSWVVGDVLDDVEAGLSAGCRAVLVDNGSESEWRISETRLPHHVARDARLQRLERVA
jgi:D-glycero-D-manno-heptose 1,7-bisphosphate phosphatase